MTLYNMFLNETDVIGGVIKELLVSIVAMHTPMLMGKAYNVEVLLMTQGRDQPFARSLVPTKRQA